MQQLQQLFRKLLMSKFFCNLGIHFKDIWSYDPYTRRVTCPYCGKALGHYVLTNKRKVK